MAAEYGALLRWPKDKEELLLGNIGKPAQIVLYLELQGLPEQTHTINIVGGKETRQEYFDEIFEKCFVHIQPIKTKLLKGSILSYIPNDQITEDGAAQIP